MSDRSDQHAAPPTGRHAIHLGNAWQPPDAAANWWRRSFGRPSGVGPGARVLLVIDRPHGAEGTIRPSLNAAPLPVMGPGPCRWEHDITAALLDRNELALQTCPAAPRDEHAEDRHGRAALPREVGRVTIEIVTD